MVLLWKRHPLSQVDYLPVLPLLFNVALAGLAGAGIAEGISALTSHSKSPSSTSPTLPDQGTANKTAAATVADQRAAMLYSGGQTDMTGGLGVLTGEDISKTGLIGG